MVVNLSGIEVTITVVQLGHAACANETMMRCSHRILSTNYILHPSQRLLAIDVCIWLTMCVRVCVGACMRACVRACAIPMIYTSLQSQFSLSWAVEYNLRCENTISINFINAWEEPVIGVIATHC